VTSLRNKFAVTSSKYESEELSITVAARRAGPMVRVRFGFVPWSDEYVYFV
jgi:hypothetical protein